MTRSLDIGATGMLAQQTNVDVISNNIANMSTTGYKRQRVDFQDMIYQNINKPGTQTADDGTVMPSGLQLGLGVRVNSVYRVHEQGNLEVTSNPLDVAISGKGFFQIQLPNGDTAYTRDGIFQMNENGEIVTTQGYKLDPTIVVPDNATSVEINMNGEVMANIQGQPDQQNLGQIQIADFINPAGLEAVGDNLYKETTASGNPNVGNPGDDQFGSLRAGLLESSNVNVVEEITKLISAQRAYEMNSNVISTSDEMMKTVTQL